QQHRFISTWQRWGNAIHGYNLYENRSERFAFTTKPRQPKY
ncbi:hypothetical protein PC128_g21077, partial [Phytophthora cactorum]